MIKNNLKLWNSDNKLNYKLSIVSSKYRTQELKNKTFKELEFGTAGIRGKIGAGKNYFNIITIRKATLAFYDFLIANYPKKHIENNGIIIGHDNRLFSSEFSMEVARVLSSYNIKVILANKNLPMPTPLVSYAIKKYNYLSGIVITASHNNKNYNGFKIFNNLGSQYLPKDTDIISKSYKNKNSNAINFLGSIKWSKIKYLDKDFFQIYSNDCLQLLKPSKSKHKIQITFSNLHGTSQKITPDLLKLANYKVHNVKKHYAMLPTFKNAPNPNPELVENFFLPIQNAKKNHSDLILLNDPDADRIGLAVLHKTTYSIISTNEAAALILNYIIENKQTWLKDNNIIYSTFVSSDLIDKIAIDNNIKIIKTHPGFKWMCDYINHSSLPCLLGYEEACGLLINNSMVRDKDGIFASLFIAEMSNYYMSKKQTLVDILQNLYKKYGYYNSKTFTKELNPNKIKEILNHIRKKPLKKLANVGILKIEDYLLGLHSAPPSNLLKLYFKDGSSIAIRGSGTEPKIKFYFNIIDHTNIMNAKIKAQNMHDDLFNNYLKSFF